MHTQTTKIRLGQKLWRYVICRVFADRWRALHSREAWVHGGWQAASCSLWLSGGKRQSHLWWMWDMTEAMSNLNCSQQQYTHLLSLYSYRDKSYYCSKVWTASSNIWGQKHKTLCSFMIETACRQKGRNVHTLVCARFIEPVIQMLLFKKLKKKKSSQWSRNCMHVQEPDFHPH